MADCKAASLNGIQTKNVIIHVMQRSMRLAKTNKEMKTRDNPVDSVD